MVLCSSNIYCDGKLFQLRLKKMFITAKIDAILAKLSVICILWVYGVVSVYMCVYEQWYAWVELCTCVYVCVFLYGEHIPLCDSVCTLLQVYQIDLNTNQFSLTSFIWRWWHGSYYRILAGATENIRNSEKRRTAKTKEIILIPDVRISGSKI